MARGLENKINADTAMDALESTKSIVMGGVMGTEVTLSYWCNVIILRVPFKNSS